MHELLHKWYPQQGSWDKILQLLYHYLQQTYLYEPHLTSGASTTHIVLKIYDAKIIPFFNRNFRNLRDIGVLPLQINFALSKTNQRKVIMLSDLGNMLCNHSLKGFIDIHSYLFLVIFPFSWFLSVVILYIPLNLSSSTSSWSSKFRSPTFSFMQLKDMIIRLLNLLPSIGCFRLDTWQYFEARIPWACNKNWLLIQTFSYTLELLIMHGNLGVESGFPCHNFLPWIIFFEA